ncbi:DJ-1/PfpI family protein [Salinisphaera sp. Q1T1-3]|uniref:DJ-1/PfpI family protein n=1 Tax=Salinisphaera sp. Q1T1-3 TaxID=2321229 RepID=UPI000E71EBBD|nr:DJ-1/PfpI family protein [Salinisphaera sp. Q1T1-3]RJS93682.1 DJ-1/PfpI family protein [Salinisphaera sp. Q1T1-3]
MTDIHRRRLLLSALCAPLAMASAPVLASTLTKDKPGSREMDMPNDAVHWVGDEKIAMLVYPQMTLLDLIGPHSMLASMMGAQIDLVAPSLEPVVSDSGVTITPTATFEDCPKDLTVLFAPGGTTSTLATAQDPKTLAFMADRGARAKYVTSVCSGSLILGAAGLLEGYKATSHWSCIDALKGFGAIPTNERVVKDRNRMTGAGVTSGLDFGLTMVAELRSVFYAQCTQLVGQYDPHPPFHAGSLQTAPPQVKHDMVKLLSDFTAKANALSENYSTQ